MCQLKFMPHLPYRLFSSAVVVDCFPSVNSAMMKGIIQVCHLHLFYCFSV